MTSIRTLTAAFALALAAPGLAQAEEVFYALRTLETGGVSAQCPPGDNVILGAQVYAPRSRAKDGLVVNDATTPIGTAVGCGKIVTYKPFDPAVQTPFTLRVDLNSGLSFTSAGTCTITGLTYPLPGVPSPLILVTCGLNVDPDPNQKIVFGSASSSSVFASGLPGYGVGSFWNIHLYLGQ